MMASSVAKPHPEQIVNLEGKEIKFNPDALRQILLQDGIKDKQVCVVSVTGVFRQGKSFLLNFLIRYLTVKYKLKKVKESNWLNSADGPVSGFPYRGGSKRHTLGILMWSEIFLAVLPSGEEVAIVLLDTQGSFDNVSSVTHCAAIFALSTLISSVQIYNLKENIKQYDLAHLECFSGYGQLLGNSDEAPFQDIVFLIRDWPWPAEKKFGAEGGQELLDEIFDDPAAQSPELVTQRKNIRALFKKISCFLLPYPGPKVATSSNFQGDLKDIDNTFKQQIEMFVPGILAPENLVAKTVNKGALKVGDLFHFIETYCSRFQNGEMPSLQSMFLASSDAHHATVLRESEMIYEKSMDFVKNKGAKSVVQEVLYGIHCKYKYEAMQNFRQKKIIGNEEIKRNFELKLEQRLEEKFLELKNLNDIKHEKEKEVARESELRRQQQLRNQQCLAEQERTYEEQLRREKANREREEWKVEQLEREQSQLRSSQSSLQSSLRFEQQLRQQQQTQYEASLKQEKQRAEQERAYEETIRKEQSLRHQQEKEYRKKLKNEEQLRQQQELEFKEQLKKDREQMLMQAAEQQESTKRERRLSH